MVEKVLFLGQFFKTHFLMKLQVFRSPEPQNHILAVILCTCMSCLSMLSLQLKNKQYLEVQFSYPKYTSFANNKIDTFYDSRIISQKIQILFGLF